MLPILPILALAILFLNFVAREHPWRRAMLLGATLWGVLLWGITESLGLFHLLQWQWVAVSWAVVLLAGLIPLVRRRHDLARSLQRLREPCPWGAGEWFLMLLVAMIILLTGIIALRTPPTNYDSYSYHLPRVLHWIQQRSVAFFPAHMVAQDKQPPFDEYILLHAIILRGGDQWANLVQWMCMIGSVISVSYLAKLLGAKARGQIFAAVICATIPMGILQSSTTQNDYAAAFWLLTMVTLAWDLLLGEERRINWTLVCAIGAALGLTMLTKAVSYLFAFPFCVLFAVLTIRRYRLGSVAPLCVAAVLALSLNVTHYTRNWMTSGYPLGPPGESFAGSYLNTPISAEAMVSNALRYVAIELNTPWKGINNQIAAATRTVHQWLGWNPDNPNWSLANFPFQMPWIWNLEDMAGSPLQTLLLLACIPLAIGLSQSRRHIIRLHLATLLCGALLLCLCLKWQVFGSRFLLSTLILGVPIMAVVLEQMWARWAVATLLTAMVLFAGPFVFNNYSNPFFGQRSIFHRSRMNQRFHDDVATRRHYENIARKIRARGCRNVALIITPSAPEYPLWVVLQKFIPGVRIENIQVKNFTASIAASAYYTNFHPCAVIRLHSLDQVTLLPNPDEHSHSPGK